MEFKCTYSGCYMAAADNTTCEYHKPADQKRVTVAEFNKAIFELIDKGHFAFNGYIFPGAIEFPERVFLSDVSFKDAQFGGNVIFKKCRFDKGANFESCIFHIGASFSGTHFRGKVIFDSARFLGSTIFVDYPTPLCANFTGCTFEGDLNLVKTRFRGGPVRFAKSTFQGESSNFQLCLFKGTADFSYCVFTGKALLFLGTRFNGGTVSFTQAKFLGDSVQFISTRFAGGCADFTKTLIDSELRFSSIEISYGLDFIETHFGTKSEFYFWGPQFNSPQVNPILILFSKVRFRPFQAFFENVDPIGKYIIFNKSPRPLFAFRDCYLKDVYFSRCNMTLFSFYTCALFEESFFTSSIWPGVPELSSFLFPFRDRVRICEEIYCTEHSTFLTAPEYDTLTRVRRIPFPASYLEIAELYLRFKASADKARDYHHASHFYQNEFEMKRLFWKQQAAHSRSMGWYLFKELFRGHGNKRWSWYGWLIKSLAYWHRAKLYFLYKHLAGYGEKPGLSFMWFFGFTIIFTGLNMMNGALTPGGIINYDFSSSFPNGLTWLQDFLYCAVVTVSRVIPISYFPYQKGLYDLSYNSIWDLLLTLSNTLVLILFGIFVGIGLKRHFRRF